MTDLDRDLADNEAAIERLTSAYEAAPFARWIRPVIVDGSRPVWTARHLRLRAAMHAAFDHLATTRTEIEAAAMRAKLSRKIRTMLWECRKPEARNPDAGPKPAGKSYRRKKP
jgi:hypothetical protein